MHKRYLPTNTLLNQRNLDPRPKHAGQESSRFTSSAIVTELDILKQMGMFKEKWYSIEFNESWRTRIYSQ